VNPAAGPAADRGTDRELTAVPGGIGFDIAGVVRTAVRARSPRLVCRRPVKGDVITGRDGALDEWGTELSARRGVEPRLWQPDTVERAQGRAHTPPALIGAPESRSTPVAGW
jgi:hypothetical protein